MFKRLLLLSIISFSFTPKANAVLPYGCLLMPSFKVIIAATIAGQCLANAAKAALIETYRTKQVQEQK